MIQLANHTRCQPENFGKDNTLLICGPQLDDRCQEILRLALSRKQSTAVEILFDSENYSFNAGGSTSSLRKSSSLIDFKVSKDTFSQVTIDITSLGFVELLLVLRWFNSSSLQSIDAVYAEPKHYKPRADYMSDFGHHEFDLTSHSGGFKAIPGFSKVVSSGQKATLIALLGFERSRLGQLLQLDDGAYIGEVLPIFGTPSYKVGWDKHCFFQNIETLKSCSSSPSFVSAYSPYDVIKTLQYIKESMPEKELMLAPFGTKPLSLGAAIFLSNNPDITLKYDHPIKKEDGSIGISRVHLFSITKS